MLSQRSGSTRPHARAAAAPGVIRERFFEDGYAAPIRILSGVECVKFLRAIEREGGRPPLEWDKARAVTSRTFLELAAHPTIMTAVCAILGEDVMLWGASIQDRAAGEIHPWHSDIECAGAPGKAVSVWIGLEQTRFDSSPTVAAGSHRFGITVQELRLRDGIRRDDATDDDVLRWISERRGTGGIVQSEVSDGEALLMHGALWHASRNRLNETRRALLLQYATPDVPIRIPDLKQLDWPFRSLEVPRPACIMVRGNDTARVNRVVPGPAVVAADSGELSARITPVNLPLPLNGAVAWKYYPLFKGATVNVENLSCHVSSLSPGSSPHAPHVHDEEELLLLLTGEADLTLPDAASNEGREERLRPGHVVYYPAHFAHTLTTASETPANYVVLRWRNRSQQIMGQLEFGHFRLFDSAPEPTAEKGFQVRVVFEGTTGCLRKLHCHVSALTPGAGYAAHIDAHDVCIVVLNGEVETLGQRVGPHGVIFYPGGEAHGLRNCGRAVAEYVVFEFHGL